ncbi:PREDICTED: CLAVATA3/ESR (CLE)-related protein 8 [Camelina sativa]|uniref:CLAVATA3/ESR (CLE)-related protein 8 n=1 Tax=Camelina sativa TaxID=90675 RepID=A0ABM0Z821_CAMSA|nr:PREDICTED: CLAVATA3/ESR (CLE)-related protein 8 [Camelina sativa]
MKVLKRDEMLLITLICILLTSSMARQNPSLFRVMRDEVPTGTDLKQIKAQPHLPPLFQIKRIVPTGPNPLHEMVASPH